MQVSRCSVKNWGNGSICPRIFEHPSYICLWMYTDPNFLYYQAFGKECVIFLFYSQNICCGYSKETSELSKQIIKSIYKKIFTILWSFLFGLSERMLYTIRVPVIFKSALESSLCAYANTSRKVDHTWKRYPIQTGLSISKYTSIIAFKRSLQHRVTKVVEYFFLTCI